MRSISLFYSFLPLQGDIFIYSHRPSQTHGIYYFLCNYLLYNYLNVKQKVVDLLKDLCYISSLYKVTIRSEFNVSYSDMKISNLIGNQCCRLFTYDVRNTHLSGFSNSRYYALQSNIIFDYNFTT